MPPFPKPTHGNGLRRFTTINDKLKEVPHRIKPHMAATVNWKNKKDFMPSDGNKPLQGAITCNGGKANVHPNGLRPFNLQELALLAGFLASHEFFGNKTSIMRQIGNGVPSKAAWPFFTQIEKSMRKFDKEVEAYKSEIIEIE